MRGAVAGFVVVVAVLGCDRGKPAQDRPQPGAGAQQAPPASREPSLMASDGGREWRVDDSGMVARIQGRLRDLGVYSGEVDGKFRPELAQALSQFQAARGLAATGKLDSATADALGVPMDEVRRVAGEEAAAPAEAPGTKAPAGSDGGAAAPPTETAPGGEAPAPSPAPAEPAQPASGKPGQGLPGI